ncbi:hypothetical protein C8J56DRAFT_740389, partial [Mycena floridula]
KYFIASRLLPCTAADVSVKKYTSDDNVGPPPTDRLTEVLHAYTHFTYVMSNHHFLVSDLQGIFDKDKVLCLFDPQSHTYV